MGRKPSTSSVDDRDSYYGVIDMFAIVKEDQVKQPLYRSDEVVGGWRRKTRAEWATTCCAERMPQETQWPASSYRLSGFLSGMRAALREWRRRKNGRLELARLD